MKFLPIVLSVTEPPGVSGIPDKPEASVRENVFERDDHTCRYCGFQSKRYMEVNAAPPKQEKLDPSRAEHWVSACLFCHQCFHLEKVPEMKSGVMIWLPEMSQAALNHVMRAVYVARISQGPMADAARGILEELMHRRDEAEARLGTSDPYILSMVLQNYMEKSHYAARSKKLDGVRVLPLDRRMIREGELEFNQFPQILAYWRSKDGPFGGKLPAGWWEMYRETVNAPESRPAEES